MHVLKGKASNASQFDRACIHLVQAIMTKWGIDTIFERFSPPRSGEYNSFFARKNDRTMSTVFLTIAYVSFEDFADSRLATQNDPRYIRLSA